MKNHKAAEYVSDLILTSINNNHYDVPEIQDILRHAIRRISDGLNCWHATNEHRSIKVKELTEGITSKTKYHSFCNKNFRHEHIVPAEVIYNYIKIHKLKTKEEILNTLNKFCITATITIEEDKILNACGLRQIMPKEFQDKSSSLFNDPFSRYKIAGIYELLTDGFKITADNTRL